MPPMTSPAPLTAEREALFKRCAGIKARLHQRSRGYLGKRDQQSADLFREARELVRDLQETNEALLADRERLEAERDEARDYISEVLKRPIGRVLVRARVAEAKVAARDEEIADLHMHLQDERDERQAAEARIAALEAAGKRVLAEEAPAYHDCTDNGLHQCAWCDLEEALAARDGGGHGL